MHEPLMALKYLPMYEHRVLKQVKEHGEYISGRGGVSLFLFEATTGGHLTPELCYMVNLALQMPRPEIVIASIARPVRTDVLACRNFRERMAHWANHNLQDMDGLLIADNSATTKVRQLSEVDELVALTKAASLSTYRVRGQKHPLEIWKTLTMQGKLIGIKAMQIPASSLGAPRKFLGFNYGTSWKKHRGYITSAYISGLRRLTRDPSCNLSNLPEAKQGGRIFFVIGPDEETFNPIKKHCELHYGLCQLCPGSAFDNEFYLLELFNIDEKALAKELEIEFKLDKKGNIPDGKTIEEVTSTINDWAGVPGISEKIWRWKKNEKVLDHSSLNTDLHFGRKSSCISCGRSESSHTQAGHRLRRRKGITEYPSSCRYLLPGQSDKSGENPQDQLGSAIKRR